MDNLIPPTYEASRARFIHDFEAMRARWPSAQLESQPLSVDPSLSIDYAWAEPSKKENLVVISTGLHGIEGYVGSAMLKVFMDEFGPRLAPENTGLLLVHAVNPWGMKNRRRCNENNIDLNRNFVWDEHFDPEINPDYEPLNPMLNPKQQISSLLACDVAFLGHLIGNILRMSITRIRQGMLSGQYRHPRGIQFGGQSTQESAQLMRRIFQQALDEYQQVIHLDLHTGYGPRYQMSIVNSTREPVSGPELMRRFNYPLIVAGNPDEFYVTIGDITEYFYQLHDQKYSQKKFYATCFEFGTFGNSLPAQIRSMRATIFENHLFQHGAKTEALGNAVRKEYEELFVPAEAQWWEKAVADFRLATTGILATHGFLQTTSEN